MKIYIFAAKNRKDLGAWIEGHTRQVMIAITQLYLYPNGPRRHWRKEVWEKFYEMDLFKHNNKLPDAKFILKNSWEVNKKWVNNILEFVIDKEEDYTPREDINTEELTRILEEYFIWIADKLSKSPVVRISEVREELDKLGLEE